MWRRVLAPFKEFGFAAGLLYVADRLLRSLSPSVGLRVYELMAQPVAAVPLLPPGRSRHLTFAEIPRDDPVVGRMPARADIKALRFEQGAKCLGVFRKGELIGYIWFCFGRYHEDEVRCTYELAQPQESAFDFDLYVFPEYRMGTAFASIWYAANEYLRERGMQATYSRMTRFNLASRNAHARLGSRRVGRVVFLQVGALEAMAASVWPYVALTRSRRVRLVLPGVAPRTSFPMQGDSEPKKSDSDAGPASERRLGSGG